jgi:hypothetical protein
VGTGCGPDVERLLSWTSTACGEGEDDKGRPTAFIQIDQGGLFPIKSHNDTSHDGVEGRRRLQPFRRNRANQRGGGEWRKKAGLVRKEEHFQVDKSSLTVLYKERTERNRARTPKATRSPFDSASPALLRSDIVERARGGGGAATKEKLALIGMQQHEKRADEASSLSSTLAVMNSLFDGEGGGGGGGGSGGRDNEPRIAALARAAEEAGNARRGPFKSFGFPRCVDVTRSGGEAVAEAPPVCCADRVACEESGGAQPKAAKGALGALFRESRRKATRGRIAVLSFGETAREPPSAAGVGASSSSSSSSFHGNHHRNGRRPGGGGGGGGGPQQQLHQLHGGEAALRQRCGQEGRKRALLAARSQQSRLFGVLRGSFNMNVDLLLSTNGTWPPKECIFLHRLSEETYFFQLDKYIEFCKFIKMTP